MKLNLERVEFGSPLLMREVVSHASHSLLEIGAGCYIPDGLSADTTYVGLNIDPRQHEILTEEVEEGGHNRFAVYFDLRRLATEVAGGKNLDINAQELERLYSLFGDSLFDTLALSNVFGEYSGSTHYPDSYINTSGHDYRGSSEDLEKLLSLSIGSRLLKSGGTLLIQEDKTPWIGLAYELRHNPDILKQYGFKDMKLRFTNPDRGSGDKAPYLLSAKKV